MYLQHALISHIFYDKFSRHSTRRSNVGYITECVLSIANTIRMFCQKFYILWT